VAPWVGAYSWAGAGRQRQRPACSTAPAAGKPVGQVAREMGLTETALRNWVRQDQLDPALAIVPRADILAWRNHQRADVPASSRR
jgi:transposase-like protein